MGEQKISVVWPDWKAVRLIGRGSYGCVYEAERSWLGRTEKAAVKELTIPQDRGIIEEMHNDGYDDESIARRMDDELQTIVNEYFLMTELKGHTNVVNCDDLKYIKHQDGLGYDVFIRMELLTPLSKMVGKGIDADIEKVVMELGEDICRALELCEKKKIVHRDVKPQNIFFSEFGDYKLGDFGIAKTMEHTTSGTKTGTYKYMSPEVYNGRPYGHGADIYSLGLVMYWLLNENRMPFLPLPSTVPTASMEDQARAKRFGGEPLPEPKNGSTALKRIVLKACAYEPKERFVSASEMRHALETIGTGEYKKPTQNAECLADEEHNYFFEKANSEAESTTATFSTSAETEGTVGAKWEDAEETIGTPNREKIPINVKENSDKTVGIESKAKQEKEITESQKPKVSSSQLLPLKESETKVFPKKEESPLTSAIVSEKQKDPSKILSIKVLLNIPSVLSLLPILIYYDWRIQTMCCAAVIIVINFFLITFGDIITVMISGAIWGFALGGGIMLKYSLGSAIILIGTVAGAVLVSYGVAKMDNEMRENL